MGRIGLMIGLLACVSPLRAQEFRNAAVDEIIASGQRPDGVVFEMMAWGDHSWDWAAPMLQSLIGRLRQRYPGLEMALVSHGYELFDLSERSGNAARPSVKLLQSLAEGGLEVYVSGRYASTRFYQPEDFLPFVRIAAGGAARVEDYLRLGFVRVKLEIPDGLD